MIPIFNRLFDRLNINNSRVNSPNQKQRAKAKGNGATINQDNSSSVTYNMGGAVPVPDVFVRIYGNGSQRNFNFGVENKSGRMLTVDHVRVCGEVTELGFTVSGQGGTNCDDLNFPADVFTVPTDHIPVEVLYHTLDDTNRKFKYSIEGEQVARAAGGYNIEFNGQPNIRRADP